MKNTTIILLAALLFASCNTTRELQMQKGTYSSIKGHLKFTPSSNWQTIPFDTTFNGFIVKNIKKNKN